MCLVVIYRVVAVVVVVVEGIYMYIERERERESELNDWFSFFCHSEGERYLDHSKEKKCWSDIKSNEISSSFKQDEGE